MAFLFLDLYYVHLLLYSDHNSIGIILNIFLISHQIYNSATWSSYIFWLWEILAVRKISYNGVTKSQTWLSNRTELNHKYDKM